MGRAKDITLRPIDAATANALVKRVHYSGKVVNNSQIHIGVFYQGKLEGAMQFGPSLDKRKLQGLVENTGWNEFIELNRMAFSDRLPRNSESRALGVAMRILRRHAPHLKWVVSFADATQCGDGTIYRAAGFVLTGIKRNKQIVRLDSGQVSSNVTLSKGKYILSTGAAKRIDGDLLPGHQLRYLYFLDPTARQRLTVPIIPFAEIERRGAGMYRGKPRAGSAASGTSAIHAGGGGAIPTPALSNAFGQPIEQA